MREEIRVCETRRNEEERSDEGEEMQNFNMGGGREGGRESARTSNDVLSDGAVRARVNLIQHNEKQVETGEEGVGKPDVFLDGTMLVVLAIDRISGCQDRAAGVEGGVDAGLGREGGREGERV